MSIIDSSVINQIYYNPYQPLCEAGIGQIIIRINKIQIMQPKVPYQIILNKWFSKNIPVLVELYLDILKKGESTEDKLIREYNLTHPLPEHVKVLPNKHKKIMKNINMGNLIEGLKQRTVFIIQRNVPSFYTNDNEINAFVLLQKDMLAFYAFICYFEAEFIKVINIAHETRNYS